MPRLWLLVCLVLLMVFTSQFEWKQQYGNEREANPSTSQKLKHISEIDYSVKEKNIHAEHFTVERAGTSLEFGHMGVIENVGKVLFSLKRREFRDLISLSRVFGTIAAV